MTTAKTKPSTDVPAITGVHPAAEIWPMVSETQIRDLAADIAENGQQSPVLITKAGEVWDGRCRLAAMAMLGIEPWIEVRDGDPYVLALSMENRRHLTTSQHAMGAAMLLEKAGKRKNGRWQRGSVPEAPGDNAQLSNINSGWAHAMVRAGTIVDCLPPEVAQAVARGTTTTLDGKAISSLDGAYQVALAKQKESKLRSGLPADLGALVDAGTIDIPEAVRRAKLPTDYQARIASGELTVGAAETEWEQSKRDHEEAVTRTRDYLQWFLRGWDTALRLHDNNWRDEILDGLQDRERFLEIEEEWLMK